MALTEDEYDALLKEVKSITLKLRMIKELTEHERFLIRVALVDYVIDKVETDEKDG